VQELEHDRYIITDQAALRTSRGLGMLYTDMDTRSEGLSPGRDPRPIRRTSLTLTPQPTDLLADALELPVIAATPTD
jgi:hypothetical protein